MLQIVASSTLFFTNCSRFQPKSLPWFPLLCQHQHKAPSASCSHHLFPARRRVTARHQLCRGERQPGAVSGLRIRMNGACERPGAETGLCVLSPSLLGGSWQRRQLAHGDPSPPLASRALAPAQSLVVDAEHKQKAAACWPVGQAAAAEEQVMATALTVPAETPSAPKALATAPSSPRTH